MKILLTLLSLYLVTFTTTTSKVVNGEEQDLFDFLFNKSRYDKRIFPYVGKDGPLTVMVGLTIYRIMDLVEKTRQLVTHAVLHLTWNDPNLLWRKAEFGGIANITVNSAQVWLPDIALYNSAYAYKSGRLVLVHYDGNITLDVPVILRTSCDVQVEDYPMDEQTCKMVFGSMGYHSSQIRVESMLEKFDLSRCIVNGKWEIADVAFKQNLEFYGGTGYYDVTFTLNIRRRVLYYAVYLIIPGILVALLAAIMFVLPQECSERITVGMAILVAFSFFFLLVSETMPPSATVSIVEGYYAITMIEMSLFFFLNVLVLRFHHMTEEKVPDWVKKYILNYGARFLRMRFRANNQMLHNMRRRRFLLTRKRELRGIVHQKLERTFPDEDSLADDKVIADVFETQIKMAARDAEWKKAAEVLNNYSLILHLLVVLLTAGIAFKTLHLS